MKTTTILLVLLFLLGFHHKQRKFKTHFANDILSFIVKLPPIHTEYLHLTYLCHLIFPCHLQNALNEILTKQKHHTFCGCTDRRKTSMNSNK